MSANGADRLSHFAAAAPSVGRVESVGISSSKSDICVHLRSEIADPYELIERSERANRPGECDASIRRYSHRKGRHRNVERRERGRIDHVIAVQRLGELAPLSEYQDEALCGAIG